MRRLLLALVVSTALFVPVAEAKRVALVIGNSDYEFVTDLVNPVNDADLMEKTLKEAGFDVIRLNNLDQRGMKLAMVEFSRKLKQGADASMFYYAGHGLEVDGRNFLVPTDSNTQSKEEADIHNVEVNSFMSLMENSGVPLNIVVLDACRNNPFRGLRSTGGGLAPVRAPVGTYVAYATAPGSVASDGFGSNSPFTLALAESIKVPGLTLEAVFKQTRTKVRAATGGEQVPFDSSAIEGDFYFLEGPQQSAPTQQIAAVDPAVVIEQPKPADPAPVSRGDDGQIAFQAAGSDLDMLRVVAGEYSETVWGKLAAARVKVLEGQLALLQAPPQADPPQADPPPADTPLPPLADTPVTPAPEGPPVIHLKADGSGDYPTIADALAAAKPGDRIELTPGTYTGGVIIEKPVEIVGIGSFDQIIWRVEGTDNIQWKAESGLIKNLTLLQADGCEKTCNAIYFANGSAVVENSSVTSLGGASIYVQGANAAPTIIKNNIHGSSEVGVYFESEAKGSVEYNDFYNNTFSGIELRSGANPTFKGNLVRDGKQVGIFINTDGRGVFEQNDIYNNAYAGIEVRENGDPIVRNNKMRDGKEVGIYVDKNGKGLFENNEVFNNALAGVEVKNEANPVLRGNKIRDGKQSGVFVHENAKGTFENNDITGNGLAGVEVRTGADPVFSGNRINNNKYQAFYIHEKGRGTYTNNNLSGNEKGAWLIEKDAGKVKRSGNTE